MMHILSVYNFREWDRSKTDTMTQAAHRLIYKRADQSVDMTAAES